ncbi:MAG: hypothetical protein ACO1RX_10810 [Candidatus Sericytochromatia bacterium]
MSVLGLLLILSACEDPQGSPQVPIRYAPTRTIQGSGSTTTISGQNQTETLAPEKTTPQGCWEQRDTDANQPLVRRWYGPLQGSSYRYAAGLVARSEPVSTAITEAYQVSVTAKQIQLPYPSYRKEVFLRDNKNLTIDGTDFALVEWAQSESACLPGQ